MKRLIIALLFTLSSAVNAAESVTVRFNLNEVKANIFSASLNEQGLIAGLNDRAMQKLEWSPIDHGCKIFRWGNKENQKKWLKKIFNNDIELYDHPIVEFVGVTPANVRFTCLVENIKYFEGAGKGSNPAPEKATTTVEDAHTEEISSLKVDVRRVMYVQSSYNTMGAENETGIRLQYTIPGRAQMIKKGIHPKCQVFILKVGSQPLDRNVVSSLRGTLILTDVSISEQGCYFGGISGL